MVADSAITCERTKPYCATGTGLCPQHNARLNDVCRDRFRLPFAPRRTRVVQIVLTAIAATILLFANQNLTGAPVLFSESPDALSKETAIITANTGSEPVRLTSVPSPMRHVQEGTHETTQWHTGKQLEEANGLALSVNWTGVPLGERLRALAQRQRIALFVDRRVDPTIPIELSLNNVTFEQFLWRLADACSKDDRRYGVCRIGDVFYFGPEKSAAQLPVLLEMLAIETAAKAGLKNGNWRRRAPMLWNQLAEPAELIRLLCIEYGTQIINDEELVHDLWPAVDLPPLKLEQRLALLLVGFDKIYLRSDDGLQIKLIDIPEVQSGPQKISVHGDAKTIARSLGDFADCEITAVGGTIELNGSVQTGYEIRRAIAELREPFGGTPELQRFSIDTGPQPRPRGEMLATIGNQMQLKLEFDAELRPKLDETITLNVSEKKLTEILEIVLDGSGLTYRVADGLLIIEAK